VATGSPASAPSRPRRPLEPDIARHDRIEADDVTPTHDGTGRVHLSYRVLDRDPKVAPVDKRATVPPGVSVFDAASWNGIAIDSTCGGHGTCKKCKVRITSGEVAPSRLDFRAFTTEEIEDGWRLACMVRVGLVTRETKGNSVYYSPVIPLAKDLCNLVCSHVTDRTTRAYHALR